jgi:plastocyanin
MQHDKRARLGAPRKAVVALLTLSAFLWIPLAGCFSEHSGATTGLDECVPESFRGPNTVAIKNYEFSPATLRVTPGANITWYNCDDDTHTSTSDTGVWNSPTFVRNQTFARAFQSAGSFPYHCAPHTFMKAVIIVQ